MKGATDAILAPAMLAEDTEESITLNPAAGTVMSIKVAAADQSDSENACDNESDTGESETGNN